jgi:hypothetical protein
MDSKTSYHSLQQNSIKYMRQFVKEYELIIAKHKDMPTDRY